MKYINSDYLIFGAQFEMNLLKYLVLTSFSSCVEHIYATQRSEAKIESITDKSLKGDTRKIVFFY